MKKELPNSACSRRRKSAAAEAAVGQAWRYTQNLERGPLVAFTLRDYAQLRPFVYHVTSPSSLPFIQHTRELWSARDLLREAGHSELVTVRRRGPVPITINGYTLVVRDQARLTPGSIELPETVSLSDFVEYLNRWVYFWPGDVHTPKGRAQHLVKSVRDAPIAVVRAPLVDLTAENPCACPHFAGCNSGATRHHPITGKARRDLSTHRQCASFEGGRADVVEVVFSGRVRLPGSTEISYSLLGPWTPLAFDVRPSTPPLN